MDRKLCVVANVRYQSPKARGASRLKGLLRYVQYRDDRDQHLAQHSHPERWTDHGLGSNFQSIASQCEALKSEHVQAFTWVINPNPDLVAFIPELRREAFVRELTEDTIQAFFEARAMDVPEYSYAIHHRETTDTDQPGRANPHAHVILPGTFDSWADGGRLPLYMNQNRRENHITLLHDIAQQHMDRLLQREVGQDWEARYDRQRVAPQPEPAHGFIRDEQDQAWRVWIATQQPAADLRHVGLLLQPEQADTPTDDVFAPLAFHLPSSQARQLTQHMLKLLEQMPEDGLDSAIDTARHVQAMSQHERIAFFEELAAPPPLAQEPPEADRSFDLDL